MTCNYCGSNWSKDISSKELREEIERRKVSADDAWKEYLDRAYPAHTRDTFLIILNFFLALVGSGLLLSVLPHSFRVFVGYIAELARLAFAMGVFMVLFSPSLYVIRKETRIRAAFWKEYSEHAEAFKGR